MDGGLRVNLLVSLSGSATPGPGEFDFLLLAGWLLGGKCIEEALISLRSPCGQV